MHDLLSIKNIINKYDPAENYTYRSTPSYSIKSCNGDVPMNDNVSYSVSLDGWCLCDRGKMCLCYSRIPFSMKKKYMNSIKKQIIKEQYIDILDDTDFIESNININNTLVL
jgi:hypothetical protein